MAAQLNTIFVYGRLSYYPVSPLNVITTGTVTEERSKSVSKATKAYPRSLLQSNHTTVKFNITLWAFRRNQLEQWAELKQQVATNTTGSDQYHQFVQTNPNRTAVIANAGAWMKSTDEYVDAFDSLLAWLDSLSKGKVMAFFRATLPGHVACKPLGEARDRESYDWTDPHELHESPYQNYSEYSMAEAIQNKPFNWRLVESFNEYAHNLLTQRQPDQLNVQWLNVFPSTILRRDGHVGFGDCLHYSLPGPTDLWVHLFFSMLMDAAKDEGGSQ
jgi:GDSL/SGNH-like Acyl-Esterase family found in Pmr5 and Cas1p